MNKPTYQIEYSYYQHNTGRGDNGQYSQTLNRETLAEAQAAATRIQAVIEDKASPEDAAETFREFHPYTGHFSWVKLHEVTRKELAVPSP